MTLSDAVMAGDVLDWGDPDGELAAQATPDDVHGTEVPPPTCILSVALMLPGAFELGGGVFPPLQYLHEHRLINATTGTNTRSAFSIGDLMGVLRMHRFTSCLVASRPGY